MSKMPNISASTEPTRKLDNQSIIHKNINHSDVFELQKKKNKFVLALNQGRLNSPETPSMSMPILRSGESAVSNRSRIDDGIRGDVNNMNALPMTEAIKKMIVNASKLEGALDINNMNALPLTEPIRKMIDNASKLEGALDVAKITSENTLHTIMQRTADLSQGEMSIKPSQQSSIINKIHLVENIVAEIIPKASLISGKQEVAIRLPMEGNNGLEILISRQGNDLTVTVKTNHADVFSQVSNARQDIQYSLESKLPNTQVSIDMDLTEQQDRQSKGYYVLPEEDEA